MAVVEGVARVVDGVAEARGDAEEFRRHEHDPGAYARYRANLPDLGGAVGAAPSATAAELLNSDLGQTTPSQSGYVFTYATQGSAPIEFFTINADPEIVGVTGVRHFFSDQTAVVRYHFGGPADASDPAL